jgi:hypothetical protein
MTRGHQTSADMCYTQSCCTVTVLISTTVLIVCFHAWLILADIQIIGHLQCFHVFPFCFVLVNVYFTEGLFKSSLFYNWAVLLL